MKKNFILLFHLLTFLFSYAQTELVPKKEKQLDSLQSQSMMATTNSSIDLNPSLHSYVSPSPHVQALMRYGEYPVDYNTGLTDMTVPLYTIKTKELTVPIEIKFHASGRMANEVNGILGMRWTLNCGGMITRTLKGRPDEWSRLTSHNFEPNIEPAFEDLYNSCVEDYRHTDYDHNTLYDSEYDIFSFFLPNGKQGKFILKNENGVKKAMPIPFTALKIEPVELERNNWGFYGVIKVTDTDGVEYFFNAQEYFSSNELPHEYPTGGQFAGWGGVPKSWVLSSIVSTTKVDTIKFSYQTIAVRDVDFRERISTVDRLRDNTVSANFHPNDFEGPWIMDMLRYNNIIENQYELDIDKSRLNVPVLSQISYRGGTVNFMLQSHGTFDEKFLEEILIDGEVKRKIRFTTNRSANESSLEYLRSVETYSHTNGLFKLEEKYNFEYYEPTSLIPGPSSTKFNKDWWGYLNSNAVNTDPHLVPFREVWLLQPDNGNVFNALKNLGYQANREANTSYKKLGMLKSIQYPTGGRTEFDYEGNFYIRRPFPPYEDFLEEGPGLRIKTIKKIPLQGPVHVSGFKYGALEDGRGHIIEALKPHASVIEEYCRYLSWDFFASYDPVTGQPFGSISEHAAYRLIDYWSDPPFERSIWGGNYVSYNQVTEYSGAESVPSQKIVYNYSLKNCKTSEYIINDQLGTSYPKIYVDPSDIWMGGKLTGKTTYKKSSTGLFTVKASQEEYHYTAFSKGSAWDMPTYRHVLMAIERSAAAIVNNFSNINQLYYDTEVAYHNANCNVYGYGFRQYTTGEEKLSQHISRVFNSDGTSIATTKNYTYDSQYLFTRTEDVFNSDNQPETKTYIYPFDETSTPVYYSMVNAHILEPVIQTDYHKGTKLLYSQRTSFAHWGGHVYAPSSIAARKGSGALEPRINFYAYDLFGNVKSLSQAGGSNVCYLWGYKGRYAIAKIENADYAAVESALGAPNIESFRDLEHPTDEQVSTFLAPLRLALPQAQLNTYRYKPLIGISSEINAYGIATQYEYDDYQRLKRIKDDEGNIKKSYEYHFKP